MLRTIRTAPANTKAASIVSSSEQSSTMMISNVRSDGAFTIDFKAVVGHRELVVHRNDDRNVRRIRRLEIQRLKRVAQLIDQFAGAAGQLHDVPGFGRRDFRTPRICVRPSPSWALTTSFSSMSR